MVKAVPATPRKVEPKTQTQNKLRILINITGEQTNTFSVVRIQVQVRHLWPYPPHPNECDEPARTGLSGQAREQNSLPDERKKKIKKIETKISQAEPMR